MLLVLWRIFLSNKSHCSIKILVGGIYFLNMMQLKMEQEHVGGMSKNMILGRVEFRFYCKVEYHLQANNLSNWLKKKTIKIQTIANDKIIPCMSKWKMIFNEFLNVWQKLEIWLFQLQFITISSCTKTHAYFSEGR